MLSWCRRSLTAAAFFAASLLLADVNVTWVNDNTVVVSGTGGGEYGPVVVTNVVGVCSNCTAVSAADANRFLSEASSLLENIRDSTFSIVQGSQDIEVRLQDQLSDIFTFRRFGPDTGSVAADRSYFIDLTNYVYTVDNAQTSLCKSSPAFGNLGNGSNRIRAIAYNNGIYDYANNFVASELNRTLENVFAIDNLAYASSANASNLVEQIRSVGVLEPCTNVTDYVGVGSGGDGDPGSGSGTNCCTFVCAWGEEQVESVLDYLKHIDEDQHARSNQLEQISWHLGNVTNLLDSYGQAISSALWTDSTIVVDDGNDSWSNVYINGYSSLYDYQRSNVLQRIELLLYGVSMGDVVATNALEGVDEIDQEQIVSDMNDVLDSLADESNTSHDDFKTAGDALVDFGESLCFLGDGSISSWTFGKIRVGSWIPGASDEYLEVPSELSATLNSFRPLFRTAFQLVYLLLCVLWCWYFYTRLFKYVVVATRYVFQFLNEAFG